MFSQEKIFKLLDLSAQFYQTNCADMQRSLAEQVLALTTLPPINEDSPTASSGPMNLKKTPSPLTREEVHKKMKLRSWHRPKHPPMAALIKEAISKMHERKGSSLQAIKKFISQSYHLDTGKLARYIRKYLREAVKNGILLHPTGHGATGHFKLAKNTKGVSSRITPQQKQQQQRREKPAARKVAQKSVGRKRKEGLPVNTNAKGGKANSRKVTMAA